MTTTTERGPHRTEPFAATPSESLKIGVIAPPWFDIPPVGYGGTEAVVAGIVDGLVDRGHEVTLVAAGVPKTRATRFIPAYDVAPSWMLGSSSLPEVVVAAEAARVFADLELDVIHDHSLAGPLLARGRSIPTISTVHGPATEGAVYYERLAATVGLVAISEAQRRTVPRLNWVGTVHNAIDVASFECTTSKGEDLLWIGRFSPDKGAHLALDAARATGRSIVLAGKLREPQEQAYFDEMVRPRLGKRAHYVGEADSALKRELYARSACLVFPIQWDEPFGMVLVEALACGTPVVATRRGSVPEIVDHGRTGIIVNSIADLPAGIEAAVQLDARDCRRSVEQRFDLPVMVAGYERVYRLTRERAPRFRAATGSHRPTARALSVTSRISATK